MKRKVPLRNGKLKHGAKAKKVGRGLSKSATGNRAVALAVGRALMRKPKIHPALVELLRG